MSINETRRYITMKDGSVWSFAVMDIARNRAEYYKDEFGGDVERSLAEDTIPLFEEDAYEFLDWGKNNMNATDIHMRKERDASLSPEDIQEAWCNGDWRRDLDEDQS